MKHELDGLLCQKSLKSLVLKVFWIHPFSIIAMKIATSQIMLNPNPNFVRKSPDPPGSGRLVAPATSCGRVAAAAELGGAPGQS